MLVEGINYFVPHAFTPKYPDPDCPPHFYARGMNCQYPLFGMLMRYTQRMSHVLTGGIHQADVAVYYNAEAEWAGGKRMLQQEVCMELTRHQIDFDMIPQDILCREASVENSRLVVHEETYGVLIVPYSQYLPGKILNVMEQLAVAGVPVWFVNDYPECSCEMCAAAEIHPAAEVLIHCGTVALPELIKELEHCNFRSVWMEEASQSLRCFHIRRGAHDIFMLWNENVFKEIDTNIGLSACGRAVFYDAWNNRVSAACQKGNSVRIRLAPAEAIVLCVGEWEEVLPEYDYRDSQMEELQLEWLVSVCPAGEREFTAIEVEGLENLARKLPDFSGIIRYDAVWNIENPERYRIMELSNVGETAQLWVNDIYCGEVVGKPYRFIIEEALSQGVNRLRLEVRNNLAYRERDLFSTYLPLPISGVTGCILVG